MCQMPPRPQTEQLPPVGVQRMHWRRSPEQPQAQDRGSSSRSRAHRLLLMLQSRLTLLLRQLLLCQLR